MSPADGAHAERVGRELGKALIFEALAGRWRAKRSSILLAAAQNLEDVSLDNAGGSPPDESRADQIGRTLAQQLVRAVLSENWDANSHTAAIAAAARHLRFYLKQNATPRQPPPELSDLAGRN